ncbi:MAG: hypothetical protein COB96_00885 [Planctomycetota bacterium]|nr:MAG: hypothetical protein COB96_00885 [Planctomycetota bacterium]
MLVFAAAITLVAAWLPLWPSLSSLLDLSAFTNLADPRLCGLLMRTIWLSTCAAALSAACGLPLAILATRLRLPGAAICALLLPLPLLLPPLLIAQAWHGMFGIDGPWAAVFTLGLSCAPFPALLAARALERQAASAHESALLSGGRKLALEQMVRTALPATALGAALAFLFIASDFAVPDYFAAVGDKFSVYAAEVFNGWRSEQLGVGAAAAAPLVLVAGLVLYWCLWLRDTHSGTDGGNHRALSKLDCGRGKLPLSLLAWSLLAVVLLAPLARILFETGAAGPNADGDWMTRSTASFNHALERGREDLARSLRTGAAAGLITLMVAPIWAHFIVKLPAGRLSRWLQVLIALPLLAPAVGTGLGTILIWNNPMTYRFYDSWMLPPLIMAGRFMPIAIFLLAERMKRTPPSQIDAAAICGAPYWQQLFRYQLGPYRSAWFLSAALVAVFSIRELDLAVLIPAANPSAAVRYYNALHFARDGFVAAFGLMIALVLFLPVALHSLWNGLNQNKS